MQFQNKIRRKIFGATGSKKKKVLFSLIIILAIPLTVITLQDRQLLKQQAQIPQAIAIPTYQSIGLYWSPPGASTTNKASVQYRKQGDTTWKDATSLWYDTRSIDNNLPEYRGSIVMLQAGTTYEVKLTLASGPTTVLTTTTWIDPEKLPIARTVMVPSGGPYTITQGGDANGYVLYTANPGDKITASTVKTDNQNGVAVDASYVIVRGLTVKGGMNGILLRNNVHHVVVDRNDISAWGPNCPAGPGKCGTDPWSAVRGGTTTDGAFNHITVQRNNIHEPNYSANLWCEGNNEAENPDSTEHPHGVRGVSFPAGSYNNVIRYNEITSNINQLFNDGMGNDKNFSTSGFPDADSDINGNIISDVADDAIESEGGNENVRIWGNYIDKTFIGIGNATTSVGPIYIFRNVMDRSEKCPRQNKGSSVDGYSGRAVYEPKEFIKIDDSLKAAPKASGGGFRMVVHNTLLVQPNASGAQNGFYVTQKDAGELRNTFSRNNIFNAKSSPYGGDTRATFIDTDLDYDMSPRNANNKPLGAHFLLALPLYAAGNGDSNGRGGMYQLAPNSPGYDDGQALANFNDGFAGTAPDMGAHEAGSPKMEFGINAYLTTAGPTNTPSITPPVTSIPTVTIAPTRAPSPTISPVSTIQPTVRPEPSATPRPNTTTLSMTLALHGLGNGGDSANPLGKGNTVLIHPQRTITVELYNQQNALVGTKQGTVTYDTASGYFKGVIDAGTTMTTGTYTMKVKTNQFLREVVPGIIRITTGTANQLPKTTLVTGDTNNDNAINILDYNILMGCYSDLSPATNCSGGNAVQADLTDDGAVNSIDYNLFIRELSNRGGQ
ncbi:MAG: hypothetical protein H0W89_08025 [Candidatus Levybacteria bacterium]|nr:hypothetical protein [Candidatus Levybacteria bacterium]